MAHEPKQSFPNTVVLHPNGRTSTHEQEDPRSAKIQVVILNYEQDHTSEKLRPTIEFTSAPMFEHIGLPTMEKSAQRYRQEWNAIKTLANKPQKPDSDLIDLLQYLPDLLDLTVNDSNLSPGRVHNHTHFVQTLHAFPSTTLSSALVTKLQSISLLFSGSTFDNKKFVDMVSSRWYPEAFAEGKEGSLDSHGETRRPVCVRLLCVSKAEV
ncbi:hypothetical protein BT96DRAFT_989335 [Gymnopus androsaceus JB14]|uniref:Uncharacterized protein n=1 Tax=Gymnopus androsaceus JB14 TaxID=1447944 RepID=A0A6A4I509_9AGAR|nr:hypothetical protein BT96DRAFT_989335 [Gymnopus androsaceus JB14]